MPAIKVIAQIFLITVLGLMAHELGHLAAAKALGYEAVLNLNSVRTIGLDDPVHGLIITGAGPLLTIGQGLLGYYLIRSDGRAMLGLGLLVCAAVQRLFAAILSLIANPNDEMRMSVELGLGSWTLYAVILAGLWWLVWRGVKRVKPGWSYAIWVWLGTSLGLTLMIFGEGVMPVVQL